MKKSQSNKDQPPKKANVKDKTKEKQNIDKKEPKKENRDDLSEEEEEYTPEEIKLLDKFHEFTDNKFEDDEIYDVMVKFHSDEELIKNELKQMLKDFSKGEEYNWQEIGKSE